MLKPSNDKKTCLAVLCVSCPSCIIDIAVLVLGFGNGFHSTAGTVMLSEI